jgi:hypothetical protein
MVTFQPGHGVFDRPTSVLLESQADFGHLLSYLAAVDGEGGYVVGIRLDQPAEGTTGPDGAVLGRISNQVQ